MKHRRLFVLVAACLSAVGIAVSASEGAALADVFFEPAGDAGLVAEAGVPGSTGGADGGSGSGSMVGVDAGAESVDSGVVLLVPQTVAPVEVDAGTAAPTAAVDVDGGAPKTEYTGLSIGLRAGFAIPGGTAKTAALGDVVKFVVPVGIDVGYYFKPNFYVGGYFLYGFAGTSTSSQDACPSGTDTTCSAQSYKWGLAAEYAFRHTTKWSPWVRGGIGFDVINLTANDSSGSTSQSSSLFGIEWAVISAGLDWKPGYFYGLGPYGEFAIGDYGKKDGLADPHFFATFGLRARTGLP